MLKNKSDFISYQQQALKDYDAQKKKIFVCAGVGTNLDGRI